MHIVLLLSVHRETDHLTTTKNTFSSAHCTDLGPNTKQEPPLRFLTPNIFHQKVYMYINQFFFLLSVFNRHGQSPSRLHLWNGRSHWAPQGKWQSQVLPRVRGRNADYSSLEVSNLGSSYGFDAARIIFISDSSIPVLFLSWTQWQFLCRTVSTLELFDLSS